MRTTLLLFSTTFLCSLLDDRLDDVDFLVGRAVDLVDQLIDVAIRRIDLGQPIGGTYAWHLCVWA